MIAILLGTGFEEIEALTPYDLLRRGGADVQLVSVMDGRQVSGGQGINVVADTTLEDLNQEQVDCVVLPGGLRGVASLKACSLAMKLVETVYHRGGTLGAICAAPGIFHDLGILENRHFTGYPAVVENLTNCHYHRDYHVVVDGNLVTAKAAGSSVTFGQVLLALDKETAVAQDVVDKIYGTTEPVLMYKEDSHVR